MYMGKNESSTDLHIYIATFPWYIQEMQNKNYHTDHFLLRKSKLDFLCDKRLMNEKLKCCFFLMRTFLFKENLGITYLTTWS